MKAGPLLLLALWLSAHSILVSLLDQFTGSTYGGLPTLTISLIVAGGLAYKTVRFTSWRTSNVALFFSSLTYLIYLGLPDGLPVSKLWDGANHLAIIRYLDSSGSHGPLADGKGLSWGGDLTRYAWGFHAWIAAWSKALNVDAVLLIHPALSVFLATTFARSNGRNSDKRVMSLYIASFFVRVATIVSAGALLNYLLLMNYWSTLAGLVIAIAQLDRMLRLTKHNGRFDLAIDVTLIVGALLVYPLIGLPMLLILLMTNITWSPLSIGRTAKLSALVGALSLGTGALMTLQAGFTRIGLAEGPVPWERTSLLAAPTAICLFIGLRGHSTHTFWSKERIWILGIIFIILGSTWIATPYFTGKLIVCALILSLPIAAAYELPADLKMTIAFAFALLLLNFFLFPMRFFSFDYHPAISSEIYRHIRAGAIGADGEGGKRIVGDAYTHAWLEALALPKSIWVPADLRERAIRFGRRIDPMTCRRDVEDAWSSGQTVWIESRHCSLCGLNCTSKEGNADQIITHPALGWVAIGRKKAMR